MNGSSFIFALIFCVIQLLTTDYANGHGCEPTCCSSGFPKHTPFDCIRPTYDNVTGCPECPTEERPTCQPPPQCPYPSPPCPDPPPENITVVPAYCIAKGGRLCYMCYVDTQTCYDGGIYIRGLC